MYENYSIFKENNLFGLKNETGEIVIQPTYREMYPFSCGLSLVRNADYHYAYINHQNIPITPFGFYDWCEPQFIRGFARVVKGQKWGVINIAGTHVLPVVYDRIWPLNPDYLGTVQVEQNGSAHRENLLAIVRTPHELKGLRYRYTMPLDYFKSIYGFDTVEVKADSKTGVLYAPIPGGRIEVPTIPRDPVISLVVNEKNNAFLLLHSKADAGKESYERTLVKKEAHYPSHYSEPDYDYEERDYLDGLMEDAFEGDPENYWNID